MSSGPFTFSPSHPFTLFFVAILLFAGALSVKAHDPITTKVTWSREVVRIVNTRCANCHNKDSVGPMPLTTYDEVKPWAKAIKDEVVSRRMPPWPAARGFGHFTNDPTLSPFEIELIAAWVDGGAPKGEEKDLPAPAAEVPRKNAGLVLQLPLRTKPPEGESITVKVPTESSKARWITAWEFVPNDGAIVQADVFVMVLGKPDVVLGHWSPPERLTSFPADSGQRLPAHAKLAVTLTYRSARQQTDFPVSTPSRPPTLGLILQDRGTDLEVYHATQDCNSFAGYVGPASRDSSFFAVRVDEASDGAQIGFFTSTSNGPGLPLAWVRQFNPAYRPTYRLGTFVRGVWDVLHAQSRANGKCRVTWDYVEPRH